MLSCKGHDTFEVKMLLASEGMFDGRVLLNFSLFVVTLCILEN